MYAYSVFFLAHPDILSSCEDKSICVYRPCLAIVFSSDSEIRTVKCLCQLQEIGVDTREEKNCTLSLPFCIFEIRYFVSTLSLLCVSQGDKKTCKDTWSVSI